MTMTSSKKTLLQKLRMMLPTKRRNLMRQLLKRKTMSPRKKPLLLKRTQFKLKPLKSRTKRRLTLRSRSRLLRCRTPLRKPKIMLKWTVRLVRTTPEALQSVGQPTGERLMRALR